MLLGHGLVVEHARHYATVGELDRAAVQARGFVLDDSKQHVDRQRVQLAGHGHAILLHLVHAGVNATDVVHPVLRSRLHLGDELGTLQVAMQSEATHERSVDEEQVILKHDLLVLTRRPTEAEQQDHEEGVAKRDTR